MSSTRTAAEQWLRALLSPGPMLKSEVMDLAASAGLPERTVHRARKRIGASYHVSGYGGNKHSLWWLV